MALDAQKALQLSALLAQHSTLWTQGNPGQNAFARQLLGSAQAGIQAEALKKAKKKQEKKEKGALGGKLGSTLGTAAGIALAPATGGASLALAAGAGGAIGGMAGQAITGGSPGMTSALGYGVEGAMSGYSYGKQGELAKASNNGADAVTTAPAAPPLAETVERNMQSAIDVASQSAVPASNLKISDPIQGFQPPAISTPRPKFGKRFGGALNHVMGQQQQPMGYRIRRQPTGTPDIYEEF